MISRVVDNNPIAMTTMVYPGANSLPQSQPPMGFPKHDASEVTPINLIPEMTDQSQEDSLLFGRRNDSESSPSSESTANDSPAPDTDITNNPHDTDTENANVINQIDVDKDTASDSTVGVKTDKHAGHGTSNVSGIPVLRNKDVYTTIANEFTSNYGTICLSVSKISTETVVDTGIYHDSDMPELHNEEVDTTNVDETTTGKYGISGVPVIDTSIDTKTNYDADMPVLHIEGTMVDTVEEIQSTDTHMLYVNDYKQHKEVAPKTTIRRGNRLKKRKIKFGETSEDTKKKKIKIILGQNPEVTRLAQLVREKRKQSKEMKKSNRNQGKEFEKHTSKIIIGCETVMSNPKPSDNANESTEVTRAPAATNSENSHVIEGEPDDNANADVTDKNFIKRKIQKDVSDDKDAMTKKKIKLKNIERIERKREQAKLLREARRTKKAERLRRERVQERQKELEERYLEMNKEDNEPAEHDGNVTQTLPEGTDSDIKQDVPPIPVLRRYVLDEHPDTKEVLVEIDPVLLAKLKPHQIEAVRFMYDCCIESIEQLDKGHAGGGCILAHCMGLGKTLSVISFIYTLMSNMEVTWMRSCLIVCPLNTVKNWVNEFQKWLSDLTYKIEVYELSNIKENTKRGAALKQWHDKGGVMILGYEMYRNLVQVGKGKVRVQKETYTDILANPGPDIVICDEGHILKNEKSLSYKAMNRILTRRRVILTGTPLQNNLKEYYHMVNYVKPLLLSTIKNFRTRFIDPITQGQCKDSCEWQIERMKKRVHVLHKILGGCVQRKDYSALTKFLPPKHEYVISVRMGTKQCSLYERYLHQTGVDGIRKIVSRNARLFRDYQTLMRIWTHPWLLTQDNSKKESETKTDKQRINTHTIKTLVDKSPSSVIDTQFVSELPNIITGLKIDVDEELLIEKTDNEVVDMSGSPSVITAVPDITDKWNDKEMMDEDILDKENNKEMMEQDNLDTEDNKEETKEEALHIEVDKAELIEEPSSQSWVSKSDYGSPPSVPDETVPSEETILSEETEPSLLKAEYDTGSSGTLVPEEQVSCSPFESEMLLADWWKDLLADEDLNNMALSGKIQLLFEILDKCRTCGDKLLVFSQSLPSLNLIEVFLRERYKVGRDNSAHKNKNTWLKEKDYFRIDGSTSAQKRKDMQKAFNDPLNKRSTLFLISTKAGSLGTNLVAANRVIIFDASWNPAHDIQSIFRVYRFGQVKPVFVYRFLAQGTMEEKIYERQVTKQSLSQRVIDEHQIERHFTAADLQSLYEFKPDRLDDPDREERPLPVLPKDDLLASLMTNQKDLIVTFHEHDSLLENMEEQELTEDEKKAAWEEYERKALHIYKPIEIPGKYEDDQNLDSYHDLEEPHENIQSSQYGFPLEGQHQVDSNSSQFDDWFNQPATIQLLDSLTDLIDEKCPDVLMSGDEHGNIQHTSSIQLTGLAPGNLGHPGLHQQDYNSPIMVSNETQNVPYGEYLQTITGAYGQSNGQTPEIAEYSVMAHNQSLAHQHNPSSNTSTSNSRANNQEHTTVAQYEDVSKESITSGKPFNQLSTHTMESDSIGDNLNSSFKNGGSIDELAYPTTVQKMPLNLSNSGSFIPINQTMPTDRDLNTPDLVINGDQRMDSYSGPVDITTNNGNYVQRTASPSVRSHFKPKQRMLERLLFESQNRITDDSPLTIQHSNMKEQYPSKAQESPSLALEISLSDLSEVGGVGVHVDAPVENIDRKPEVLKDENKEVTKPIVDINTLLIDDQCDDIDSVTDKCDESKPLVEDSLKDEINNIPPYKDSHEHLIVPSHHSSLLDQHKTSHEAYNSQTLGDTEIISKKDEKSLKESQETEHENSGIHNGSDDVQNVDSILEEEFGPSKTFLPHGIPYTVFDMSIARQQSTSPSSRAKSLPFSAMKSTDYDDISDNENS